VCVAEYLPPKFRYPKRNKFRRSPTAQSVGLGRPDISRVGKWQWRATSIFVVAPRVYRINDATARHVDRDMKRPFIYSRTRVTVAVVGVVRDTQSERAVATDSDWLTFQKRRPYCRRVTIFRPVVISCLKLRSPRHFHPIVEQISIERKKDSARVAVETMWASLS